MTRQQNQHCQHCGVSPIDLPSQHPQEHPGLCCDCFDLSWFPEKREQINRERREKGLPPVKPWPMKKRGRLK